MKEFVVEKGNSQGLFCFFEDEGETGYFYLYEPDGEGIVDHLHIYSSPKDFAITEGDVEVVWSSDETKCGVKLWGGFYGVFDLSSNQKFSISVKNRSTPPIHDATLLEGFPG